MRTAARLAILVAATTLSGCGLFEPSGCSDEPVTPACNGSLDWGDCMDEGGCWLRFYAGEGCACPATDTGKPCARASDCEGRCEAPPAESSPCGDLAAATCSRYRTLVSGCACVLDEAGAPQSFCAD